jgi:alcohol dehydrogenase class IV
MDTLPRGVGARVKFEFATSARIVFGEGALADLGLLASALGQRALVVGGKSAERRDRVRDLLRERGIESAALSIETEPTTEDARRGVALAREADCDLVVAIGGGSAIDAGKAVAALVANGGDPLDYLEVIGKGRAITRRSLPLIAIPTTAGTGSEVTRNAVLEAREERVKVSLRSALMLPEIALIDPLLTHTVPPRVTASTGFDALSQVIEPLVSCRSNPLTDGLCREAIGRSARSLARACADGSDAAAREELCITSLIGGIALANAKLGGVHGFAGPIGGMFHTPHGETCAVLLPHVMQANLSALRAREPRSPVIERYAEVARLLTGRGGAQPEDGVAWVSELCKRLGIPKLRGYGITPGDFGAIADKAAAASSMQGNPIVLSRDELLGILERAF